MRKPILTNGNAQFEAYAKKIEAEAAELDRRRQLLAAEDHINSFIFGRQVERMGRKDYTKLDIAFCFGVLVGMLIAAAITIATLRPSVMCVDISNPPAAVDAR